MEVISAAGASAEGNQKGDDNQQSEPDTKQGAHGSVGGIKIMNNEQGGNIAENRGEKTGAAPSRCFQDRHV
jgi:hypothetical protein